MEQSSPNQQTPQAVATQPNAVASRGLKKSDVIAILLIGEVFALLLMVIRKSVGIAVPQPIMYSLPILMPLVALFCLWVMSVLGRKRPVLFQVGKYAAIGFFNTGIDLGVFNAMVLATRLEPRGIVAGGFSSVSFTIAVINSYFWNKYWTFRKEGGAKMGEFMQFVIVSLIGLIINFLYVSGMTKYINPFYGLNAQQWANVVKVTGIFISLAWNFTGYKFMVFRERKPL